MLRRPSDWLEYHRTRAYSNTAPFRVARGMHGSSENEAIVSAGWNLLKVDGTVGSLDTEGCATKYIRAKHTGLTLISNTPLQWRDLICSPKGVYAAPLAYCSSPKTVLLECPALKPR